MYRYIYNITSIYTHVYCMGRSSQNRLLLCLCWNNKLLWFQAKFRKSRSLHPSQLHRIFHLHHRWTLGMRQDLEASYRWWWWLRGWCTGLPVGGWLTINRGVTGFSDLFKNNIDGQTKQDWNTTGFPRDQWHHCNYSFSNNHGFREHGPPLTHLPLQCYVRGKVKLQDLNVYGFTPIHSSIRR